MTMVAETPAETGELPDPAAFTDLPALEYMRGYLAHYEPGGQVLDETARGWLDALIAEVEHLRTVLTELRVDHRAADERLTPAEVRTYRLMRNTQMTLTEIANAFWVSPNTTKTHAKNIYAKLKVHHRGDLRNCPNM